MSIGKRTGCKENLNDLHHVECDLYILGICSDMNETLDTTVFEYQIPKHCKMKTPILITSAFSI